MVQRIGVRPPGHPHQFNSSKTGPMPPPRGRTESRAMVTPLARGLAVLAAFDPQQAWLGNKQIALETGLPTATVSRLLRSLTALGYLHHDDAQRKYRLAAAALGLGYAAIADGDLRRVACGELRKLAEATDTYVTLGARDQLDVVVIESHVGSQAMLTFNMMPGSRFNIAATVAGAALLAVLPELESCYLMTTLEHKAGREWPAQRRRIAEKISQVHALGFCMSPGEWVPEFSSVSTPISIPERPPWVLSCTGHSSQLTRRRMEREIGPLLVATAERLRGRLTAPLV